ncbi:hypothetical protein QO034_14410 [Sedimentitalea sp. JM2-8]|uniref:Inhibitor of g-type lysozyme n=1 Tax=Sedimentitalea xiamensis TaxID=3050037 RepID=A0ABT7FGP8_9RHOB|nr:hypothetical protein [Sedimentitalea xiamensis]MDK3074301.1 hypothetical protein [Sedimentitalea xiamensis]
MRNFTTRLLALALSALTFPALAQSSSEVHFEPGNYGTMVDGIVDGNDYSDFTLGARAGQEMFVELTVTETNGDGTVYFNILPPGSSGEAIYNSSMDGNSTTVDLPKDGQYTIRVYQMGNDADTGKIASFNVDLSIQ